MMQDFPGSDIRDLDGLAVCWADVPFAFWDVMFLAEPILTTQGLREQLRSASSYMRGKRQAGFLVLADELLQLTPEDAKAVLEEERFTYAMRMRGMDGDVRAFSPASPVAGLEIRRVTDDAMLEAYALLNCEAYSMPPAIAASSLTPLWREPAFSYIGYVDGQPVSASSTIVHDGHLYVGLVATHESHRRRGYAEALLRHSVGQAHQATGITRTTLDATDAGFPTYLRIGYKHTSTLHAYVPTL